MNISISNSYDPKLSKDENHNKVSQGWKLTEVEWQEDKIIELTTSDGVSCNEYSDGHRCTESWVSSHAIMLDFDDGYMTSEELLNLQKHWQFNSYVFTSQNHMKPKHTTTGEIKPACDRLRVLIPLTEPIRDEFDRQAVERYLISKYDVDGKNVLDQSYLGRTRYFAHGTTEVSNFIGDLSPLDWKQLPGLYDQPKGKGRPEKTASTFRLDDQVMDHKGNRVKIADVEPDTPIFCPVCGDANFRSNLGRHNAVKKFNEDGLPFIFCSSCQSRNMGVSGSGVYNLHPDDAFKLKSEANNSYVFIDTLTSEIYGGCHDKQENDFVIRKQGGFTYAKQFCKFHGIPVPDVYPRARFELRFNSDNIIDFDNELVNKYRAPEVLKTPIPEGQVASLPKTIGKILDHVVAHDKEILDQLINDLAYLVQRRRKLITAYLFQGTQGTGKGLLFSLVLSKIFGKDYCSQTDQGAFGKEFNGYLSNNVLLLVNELQGDYSSKHSNGVSIIDKIKQAISDSQMQIENKSKDRFNGTNNCSFFFASNNQNPLIIANDDRRFNVAPRQERKINQNTWWPGDSVVESVVDGELQEFVWYLRQYKIDESKINRVIDNEAKRKLQSLSKTVAEEFFNAVLEGNVSWLRDNLPKSDPRNTDRLNEVIVLVDNLRNQKGIATRDLCDMYNVITKKDLSPVAFGKIAGAYLPKPGKVREGANEYYGIKVNWIDNRAMPI